MEEIHFANNEEENEGDAKTSINFAGWLVVLLVCAVCLGLWVFIIMALFEIFTIL